MSKSPYNQAMIELLDRVWMKYRDRLNAAMASKDQGWHRMSIKIEAGQIKAVQLVLDESYAVDVKNDSR